MNGIMKQHSGRRMTNDTQLSLRDTTLKAISFHGREM
jgi:hypothetical protein